MKFVILALLIVLVIAFFVVLWKASKHWRWYNIVAASITMLLAVAFLFPTAGVLKSRAAWHQIKETLEQRADDVEQQQHRLKFGDPTNPAEGEGVISLSQKLASIGIEAGRRWRSLRMQTNDPNSITLSRAAPPDGANVDAAAGGAATGPLIPESMVVFGFAEGQVEGVQDLIPTFYLGEFKITASTPDQVTLAPTGELEQNQLDAITQSKAKSWSLYELLPLDGHSPFIAPGSVPDNDNLFGRTDAELVKQTLESAARLMGDAGATPPVLEELSKRRAETMENYLRNGQQVKQDDKLVSRWILIEFLKNYDSIDVDSEDQRGAVDGGFFDGSGRAVDSRLKHGTNPEDPKDRFVKFKPGDQIAVKEEEANKLIDEGTAKLINRYYVRPLNDYRSVLRRIRLRLTELATRSSQLEYESKVLQDAITATESMTTITQSDKLKLEQELAQYAKESEALTDYVAKLQAKLAETRKTLMELYQSNQQLVDQLNQIDRAIMNRNDGLTALQ